MHEWHTSTSKNPLTLINEFERYEFNTDWGGVQMVSNVEITNVMFRSEEEALSSVTRKSYGGTTAYMAAYTTKKTTKGFQNAFTNFLAKRNEYKNFKNNLTIAYGRTSSKATCPECGSSISLKYGRRFRECPVCGSKKIISDSNWNTLKTKKGMMEKAAEHLKTEAEKCEVTFVCGIEWHC